MGIKTYVVSIPGNYPGLTIADAPILLNTTDSESILAYARKEGINGICTTGTDVAVKSIGYVCSVLRLTGISYECAELVTDKAKIKIAMASKGVKTAEFSVCHSFDEVKKSANRIGYPVMIKTVDQAASKGISKVNDESELQIAFCNAISWTKKDYIVVEKCLIGKEIGLDGYVDSTGKCTFFIHNKVTYNNGKTNVPVGHSMPFMSKNTTLINLIRKEATAGIQAVNMRSSFFNMDIMLCNNIPFIIEIGGRTGSTCIPEMISEFTGENYYKKIIENALGEPVIFNSRFQKPCAVGFLRASRNGIIKSIDFNALDLVPNASYKLDISIGDVVKEFELGSDRIGQVVCFGESLSDAENNYSRFQNIFESSITYE